MDHFGGPLGRSWGALGRPWGAHGDPWGALGALLGALGVLLGALGALLGALEPLLSALGVLSASLGCPWHPMAVHKAPGFDFRQHFAIFFCALVCVVNCSVFFLLAGLCC